MAAPARRRSAADELDEAAKADADPDYLFFLSHLYPDPQPDDPSSYVLDIPEENIFVRYRDFANVPKLADQPPSSVVIDDPPPPPSAREVEVDSAAPASSVDSNDDDDEDDGEDGSVNQEADAK
uniref:Uncharacterized protein n=1 Tax=Leersia perrieri TaxID=77586 RepID=A0A0D9W4A5_9ORYZ